MDDYIALARREHAPRATLLRLEALELDDKALTLKEHGRLDEAMPIYKQAMDKAVLAGGDALDNDFTSVRQVVCYREPHYPHCR